MQCCDAILCSSRVWYIDQIGPVEGLNCIATNLSKDNTSRCLDLPAAICIRHLVNWNVSDSFSRKLPAVKRIFKITHTGGGWGFEWLKAPKDPGYVFVESD